MKRTIQSIWRGSIKWRLLAIILAVTSSGLFLTGLGLFLNEQVAFRNALVNRLSVLADVVSNNITAALAFRDDTAAIETLSALRSNQHILQACIFDIEGYVFAQHVQHTLSSACPVQIPFEEEHRFEAGHLMLLKDIKLNGQKLGTIYLLSDTEEFNERMKGLRKTLILLFVCILVFMFMISVKLQGMITEPIIHLVGITREVARNGDYTLRASLEREDELGVLADGFNSMLAAVRSAEAALRQKTLLLESVVESIGKGLVAVDCHGRYVVINTEAEKILGVELSKQDSVGPTASAGFLYSDQTTPVPAEELPLARALQGEAIDDIVLFLKNDAFPDGAFIQVTARPMRTPRGEIEGAVAGYSDISHLMRTEEELKRRNEEMEQFVYTVSHDLKSPLVTSKGFLGLLREDLGDHPDADVQDSINRIDSAVEKMGNLIEDLLNLSRVGRLKNDSEPVDLVELIGKVESMHSQLLEECGASLTCDDELPVIYADASAIERVFDNLVGNAIKYGCSSEGNAIHVGVRRLNNELHLFVRDNGPGIDPRYHEKIFGLFQRIDTEHEGSGIGLAISAKIVYVHGGRIWVESELQRGATFWVSLPAELELRDGASTPQLLAGA